MWIDACLMNRVVRAVVPRVVVAANRTRHRPPPRSTPPQGVALPGRRGYGPAQVHPKTPARTDINGDGSVNVLDLIDLLLAFGTACQ